MSGVGLLAERDTSAERDPLADRVRELAHRLVEHLPAGSRAAALETVAGARELARVVEEALRAAVDLARDSGHTWQEIGEVLGTSRQAAFQRFGRPIDPRTGVAMAEAVLPGVGEHAVALLAELSAGRWEAVRRDFDETMLAALDAARIAAVWAQVVGAVGCYERLGEPFVRQLGDFTVVDVPLHFEAGEVTGRVSYGRAAMVAGLHLLPPEMA